jgi:hypothetical protein
VNPERALWLINISLEVALLALLIHRKAYEGYRTFFVYRVVGTFQSFVLLFLVGHYTPYLWTYWLMEIAGLILLGAVLLDLFERLLPPSSSYRSWSKTAFYLVCFLAVGIAIISVPAKAGAGVGPVNTAGLRAEEGMTIIHAVLVIFIVLYTVISRPQWSNWSAWIFVGICFLVATELLAIDQYLQLGIVSFRLYSWTKSLSFMAAFVIWIWGFSREAETAAPRAQVDQIQAALRKRESQ